MSNRPICHIQSGKTYCAVFCASLALLADSGTLYSCPQRSRSFSQHRARIATSALVLHRTSAIHGLSVKSDKSDWSRIGNKNSAHTQKIGFGQRSRFLLLTKRSAASGDENDSGNNAGCNGGKNSGLLIRYARMSFR